ncbi:hypothetical protein LC567_10290 [Fusobacterium animalis]|uniref:hypothetical protein n=1 Tax=Fusobacterium animalis TaxID=76859 RepID=UPI0030CECAC9
MGTSSSFKGKVGNALLPNDFNSDDDMLDENIGNEDYKDDDKNATENSINWTTAKTSMSKYISSSGKVGSPKSIVRNYIKASGGSSRLISNSSNSRTAASKIGNILIRFTTQGIGKTLDDIGLSLQNRSLPEAMSRLVNYVQDSAVSKNDVAIRTATANTFEKLIELKVDDDRVDQSTATVLMQYFMADLLWQQMLIDFGYSFEKYGNDLNMLIKVEEEMKEYIKANVEEAFRRNKGTFFSQDMYDDIMKTCLEIMEE